MNSPIILASNSPRRKQLLEKSDLSFKVIPSNVYEDFDIKLPAKAFVEYYAEQKALNIANIYRDHYVIGADTIVVLDKLILGKPKDRDDSYNMLKSLSGKTHMVYTGVSILHKNYGISKTFHEITEVTFNTLCNRDILYYIDTYNPFDKAGSYGIQDWFSVCIKKINGCFYNVMGLPLSSFYKHFNKLIK